MMFLGVAAVAYASFLFVTTYTARAGAGQDVSGYAWSETGGWISFNATNRGDAADYGVNVDPLTGNFSGYAWSDIAGWISFEPSDITASPSCGMPATLSTTTNKVSGWARVLSGKNNGLGGGCIRLTESGSPAYPGVTYNTGSGELEGYAWEPDQLGWISFNCTDSGSCGTSNYAVHVAIAIPNPPAPTITGSSTGTTGLSYPFTFLVGSHSSDIRYGIDWDNIYLWSAANTI